MNNLSEEELKSFFRESIVDSAKYGLRAIRMFHFPDIDHFSELISGFEELERLDIFYTKVKLEKPLDKLVNLKSLWIRSCGINEIPEVVCSLSKLENMGFQYSEISEIPENISSLKNLKFLNLEVNRISVLPEGLCKLGALKKLLLWGNQIRELPGCFHQLSNLETLSLDNNNLEKIPDPIYKMGNLKFLSLPYNMITHFPEDLLIALPNLEKLHIYGNPIANLPKHILEYKHPETNSRNVLQLVKEYFSLS